MTTQNPTNVAPNIPQQNPGGVVLTGLTVPERMLASKGAKRGELSALRLEEVRDYLMKLETLQQPIDYRENLSNLFVEFANGHMKAQWTGVVAQDQGVFYVSEIGAQQLAGDVLPAKFFPGLRKLINIDAVGADLSTKTWSKFASQVKSGQMNLVRTVNMRVNGSVKRVVRGCLSKSYSTYSNLQFVQDILDHAGEFAELPVISFQLSDSVMRIRFAGIDHAALLARFAGDAALLALPLPVIEAWNSEVGHRRIGLRSGMIRLSSLTGCPHWSDAAEKSWIHRGAVKRIQKKLEPGFRSLVVSAQQVCAAYTDAQSVTASPDIKNWLNAKLDAVKPPPSVRLRKNIEDAFSDVDSSDITSLAAAVDALTLAATKENGLVEQYDVELLAAKLLQKGLKEVDAAGMLPDVEEAPAKKKGTQTSFTFGDEGGPEEVEEVEEEEEGLDPDRDHDGE